MRLLLDQNLSQRLKSVLIDLYPDTIHVKDVGLESADDINVWAFAREQGLTIVSKDSDFRQFSFVYGPPPKVVWIRRGNRSTSEIASLLRDRYEDIAEFHDDENGAFLALV